MHDFDFDVMQKKRIARGAAHMKRGSKSKRCSLPSDYMTPAEWKRRNGPVVTYKFDAPMNWKTFKSMPEDLQVQYIRNMQELYRANDQMLSDMFHVHFSYFSRYRALLGLAPRRERLTSDEKHKRDTKWRAFLNGAVGGDTPVEETVLEEPIVEEPITAEPIVEEPIVEETKSAIKDLPEKIVIPKLVYEEDIKPLSLDELTAVFTGVFNPTSFLQWLAQLPIPEDSVRIKVEVTRK